MNKNKLISGAVFLRASKRPKHKSGKTLQICLKSAFNRHRRDNRTEKQGLGRVCVLQQPVFDDFDVFLHQRLKKTHTHTQEPCFVTKWKHDSISAKFKDDLKCE